MWHLTRRSASTPTPAPRAVGGRAAFGVSGGRSVVILAAAFVALALGGCSRELFTGDPYRSQYDRYDQAQSQLAEDTVVDAYGNRRPNLRARLQPRD